MHRLTGAEALEPDDVRGPLWGLRKNIDWEREKNRAA